MLLEFDVKMGGIDKDMSLDEFAKKVLIDKNVIYEGDWVKHLLDWYNASLNDKRILIVTFEEMIKKPGEVLEKIHAHIGGEEGKKKQLAKQK